MLHYDINDQLQLRMFTIDDAEALFQLTMASKPYLREWLGWLDYIETVEDSRKNIEGRSELLTTYLLRKLKWELLGKTVLLLATIVYQARRVVPTLKDVQSANINRLILALMSRS